MGDQKIIIPFSGLKEGDHSFTFDIDNSFFDCFDYSEIKKGKAKIDVLLRKNNRLMVVETGIVGKVEVECDRCLEIFDLNFHFNGKLFVKFGDNPEEGNEEVFIINENDCEIDLTHYIYESIHLSLPYKKVHPQNEDGSSGCKEEMVDKLKNHSFKEDGKTDPRWDKLKDLM